SAGTLTLSGMTISGSGTLANGGTLVLYASTVNAPLANQGTLLVQNTSAINSAAGAFTTTAGSTLRLQAYSIDTRPANLTVANGFSNLGLIDLNASGGWSATLTVSAGTLSNAAGATLSATGTADTNRTLAAQLVNQGTVSVSQPLTLYKDSAQHSNSG